MLKLALTAAPLVALVAVVGVGCAKEKPKVQASALDVARPAAPAAGTPAYQPPPPAPPAYDPSAQAVRSEPVAPAAAEKPGRTTAASASASAAGAAKPAAASGAAAGNRTYVVQKGDTLFGIAKSEYGDGGKYKKIAAANPGLNAGALKAGQKIVIPQ